MGKTVPSFRLALAEEESVWKKYRQYLGKLVRKDFNNLFTIPGFYLAACSVTTTLVRLDLIKTSINLHHFRELKEIAERRGIQVQPLLCH